MPGQEFTSFFGILLHWNFCTHLSHDTYCIKDKIAAVFYHLCWCCKGYLFQFHHYSCSVHLIWLLICSTFTVYLLYLSCLSFLLLNSVVASGGKTVDHALIVSTDWIFTFNIMNNQLWYALCKVIQIRFSCLQLVTFDTSLFHLSVRTPGNFDASTHNISGVSKASGCNTFAFNQKIV